MKKILIFLLLQFLVLGNAYAASPSASPSPSNSAANENLIDQIDQLKDKVASRVAELKLVEKRGIIGTVTEATDTQITVEDVKGNVRFIDVDELTKFTSSEKASFGISDVKKGVQLGALGLYNKESRRLLARFIDVLDLPKMYSGAIIGKDDSAFTLTFATESNKELTIDVENITRSFNYQKDGSLEKTGFTKISNNLNAVIIGFPDSKNPNKISASRIIVFPDVPKNPKIFLSPSPSPLKQATSSAKSLAPSTTPKK